VSGASFGVLRKWSTRTWPINTRPLPGRNPYPSHQILEAWIIAEPVEFPNQLKERQLLIALRECPMPKRSEQFVCICMEQTKLTPSGKPFDIHERLLLFACDIVKVTQFLHTRGAIARQLSYQLLNAGTSVGSNAEEADGASSHNDFIAKNRIALKEAKETRFRLRVCQRCHLLAAEFDPVVQESDELVKILGKIVHNALRNAATEHRTKR
jgi:four helix bundle protein